MNNDLLIKEKNVIKVPGDSKKYDERGIGNTVEANFTALKNTIQVLSLKTVW